MAGCQHPYGLAQSSCHPGSCAKASADTAPVFGAGDGGPFGRATCGNLTKLQIAMGHLGMGLPPPGLHVHQPKSSHKFNYIARARIRQFESDMPSQAVWSPRRKMYGPRRRLAAEESGASRGRSGRDRAADQEFLPCASMAMLLRMAVRASSPALPGVRLTVSCAPSSRPISRPTSVT